MSSFKSIAKVVGAAAKKEKERAEEAAQPADDKAEGAAGAPKSSGGTAADGASGAGGVATEVPGANKATKDVTKTSAEDEEEVSAEEEARLRATYKLLRNEHEELKQRNRFMMQMLAVSQLDERQLEDEVKQKEELLSASFMSSEASPVSARRHA